MVVIVPAIQNSIFTITRKLMTFELGVGAPSRLLDTSIQTSTMTSNFLITAYSITWLGQEEPPFTTESYTLAPSDLSAVESKNLSQAAVTTSTTRFWSEIRCWEPASVTVNTTSRSKRTSFADGMGCETKDVFSDEAHWNTQQRKYMALHIPVDSPGFAFEDGSTRESNVSSMCPDYPNRFLSIWWVAGSDPDFKDLSTASALFCDIDFFLEPVFSKVMVTNQRVLSYNASGPRRSLSLQEFNMTHFHRITEDGQPPNRYIMNGDQKQMKLDISETSPVPNGRWTRAEDVGFPSYPTRGLGMLDWLLALSPAPTPEYLNPATIAQSYDRAYKQLFALAMGHNFAHSMTDHQQDANLEIVKEAITLVPVFMYLTEALLAIALILCIWLAWRIASRPLELFQDPDCLAQVMDLARSPTVRDKVMGHSQSSEVVLKADLKTKSFELAVLDDGRPGLRVIDTLYDAELPRIDSHDTARAKPQDIIEVSWVAMIVTILLIIAAIVSLYVMDNASRLNNGIPLPKANAFVIQLALNFTPTVFATLLGYFVTAACRIFAFMKPMEDLKKGHARAKSTLLAKYTSIPPILLFPRAIQAGHYVLALLSIMTLLSNVLTVTMAGLFVLYQTSLVTSTTVMVLKEPFLDLMVSDERVLSGGTDTVYTVAANQSGYTRLPTWTTKDYAYMPLDLTDRASDPQGTEIEYESLGYGADLDCIDLLTARQDQHARFNFSEDNSKLSFDFCYGYVENDSASCGDIPTTAFHWQIDTAITQVPNDAIAAYEFQGSVSRPNTAYENSTVWNSPANEQQIVLAWLRGRWATEELISPTLNVSSTFEYNATIIACRPRLKTQQSTLRIDSEGNVISSETKGEPDYELGSSLNLTNSLRTTVLATAQKYPDSTIGWHAGILAQDWPNYLYKTILNSTGIIDPTMPVPSVDFASEIASETFGRLFAAQVFLDRQYLRDVDTNTSQHLQSASIHRNVRRFRLSKPMYIITQILLTLDLIVLLISRLTLSRPFLPREPFTIASQIAFAADSHVINDVSAALTRVGSGKKDLSADALSHYRFGYGSFIGKDRRTHVGIERDPFIQHVR